jgi:hypothetical protein
MSSERERKKEGRKKERKNKMLGEQKQQRRAVRCVLFPSFGAK